MKSKIIISILFVGAALVISGCQKQGSEIDLSAPQEEKEKTEIEIQTQGAKEPETDLSGWKTYNNEARGYRLKYPDDWFFVDDYCCPPPPAAVNFNNYSSKKLEYATHQMEEGVQGIEIFCGYEGVIDDIGEVQYFRDEGLEGGLKKVNGFDAIRFKQSRGPGSSVSVVSYYIVDGQQGCRFVFEDTCALCENIVSTFSF
jgi:hypothetical protein